MQHQLKEAVTMCNTILRNGFDAYIISPRLQLQLARKQERLELDIATDMSIDDLMRLFADAMPAKEPNVTAELQAGNAHYRFYPTNLVESSHPDAMVVRYTERLANALAESGDAEDKKFSMSMACTFMPRGKDMYEGFEDLSQGVVSLGVIPETTLKTWYLLGVRAMRFAANYHLPIEPNTWMAIVRNARRIIDYVSVSDIMDEWRKVDAENMHSFVRMLFDSQLLHGLIPEVAALARVRQTRAEQDEESVLGHTLAAMRYYPEELPYDWYGVMALLFHDVGKLYTAEYVDDTWIFAQHPQVGAQLTRTILVRLRFLPEDIDLICHLVRYHTRFNPMLTDKGIRRFMALDQYPRLIEMARANIKARDASYVSFNHNMKIMERADEPVETLEPLLNGNEIMEFAGLKPGPTVGLIREALLQAQIKGDVFTVPEAVEFVSRYKDKEKLAP